MIYNWIKIFHVIGAAILFGTGLSTALYKLLINRTRNVTLIADTAKKVVYADWIFTGTAGVLQPLTGMIMVLIKGYSILTFWVFWSLTGYFIAAICWFPVAHIQIKLRDMAVMAVEQKTELPPHYFTYYKIWFALGWPAFLSLTAVFFLMSNRPENFTDLMNQLFHGAQANYSY